jgi:eukaryotic-like serine/threonine-protein kinase
MAQYSEHTVHGRRRSKRDPLIGSWLDDRYLIEERIATGGFAAIYRARTAGGMAVALKVLHPRLTGDASMVARFQREGATLTQLHDPHTVNTLAVGETAGGMLYIAMELLTGESLHARLERENWLPWQSAVEIAQAVCSSLAEAHALGVVHRDLKPGNIQVETRGGVELVKVIDFGIVRVAPGSVVDDGMELTGAGHMIGTCDYMSPEQIVGDSCSAASDIYSLGVVLYEMLTGRRPFAELTTPAALMTALLTRTPPPPSSFVALPPAIDRIVMRCLERAPSRRFAGAAELAAALDRLAGRDLTAREATTTVHPACLQIESIDVPLDDAPAIYEVHEVAALHDAPELPPPDRTLDDDAYVPYAWMLPSIEPPPAPRPTPRGSARDARPPGFSTLQGVAVPTERPSRPRLTAPPQLAAPTPAPRPPFTPPLHTPRPAPLTRSASTPLAVPLRLAAPPRRRKSPWPARIAGAAVIVCAAVLAGFAAFLVATSL